MRRMKYKRLCRSTQRPIKHFNIKFAIVLLAGGVAAYCSTLFGGFNPVFTAACGIAGSGIFMLIFGMVKE